jgi:hypothetical protein
MAERSANRRRITIELEYQAMLCLDRLVAEMEEDQADVISLAVRFLARRLRVEPLEMQPPEKRGTRRAAVRG